jgi:hypothetical protein
VSFAYIDEERQTRQIGAIDNIRSNRGYPARRLSAISSPVIAAVLLGFFSSTVAESF